MINLYESIIKSALIRMVITMIVTMMVVMIKAMTASFILDTVAIFLVVDIDRVLEKCSVIPPIVDFLFKWFKST